MTDFIHSAQQSHRQRFARAVVYAKQSLVNPAVLGAYAAIIEDNQPIYIAALKDAMHAPKLSNLLTDAYTGGGSSILKGAGH